MADTQRSERCELKARGGSSPLIPTTLSVVIRTLSVPPFFAFLRSFSRLLSREHQSISYDYQLIPDS